MTATTRAAGIPPSRPPPTTGKPSVASTGQRQRTAAEGIKKEPLRADWKVPGSDVKKISAGGV